jgi:hypothetical protein
MEHFSLIQCVCGASYWRHYQFNGEMYRPQYYAAEAKAAVRREVRVCKKSTSRS